MFYEPQFPEKPFILRESYFFNLTSWAKKIPLISISKVNVYGFHLLSSEHSIAPNICFSVEMLIPSSSLLKNCINIQIFLFLELPSVFHFVWSLTCLVLHLEMFNLLPLTYLLKCYISSPPFILWWSCCHPWVMEHGEETSQMVIICISSRN